MRLWLLYMAWPWYMNINGYIQPPVAGIIFGGDSERFAHVSAKNPIEFGLMVEKCDKA